MSSHSYTRSSFFLSQTPVPLTACRSIPLSKKTTFQTFLRLSSSANNWFLPCHFCGSALPRGQVQTSLASLPWPTVPWPPPFSLHTAYMLPDWFSLCLRCPRLVPPSGLARMLSRIDPLALSPHTLSVLLGLTQLSKLWAACALSHVSLSPLVWVPAVFQRFRSHWAFLILPFNYLTQVHLVTSSAPSSPWGSWLSILLLWTLIANWGSRALWNELWHQSSPAPLLSNHVKVSKLIDLPEPHSPLVTGGEYYLLSGYAYPDDI